jgi:hypothetical protein
VAASTQKIAAPAVSTAPAVPPQEVVDLFGDSLGYQAETYLDLFLAETGKYTVSNSTISYFVYRD